jgi:hypothetical protein
LVIGAGPTPEFEKEVDVYAEAARATEALKQLESRNGRR